MTQEPQDPEEQKPPASPTSAWAPRPEATPASREPESGSTSTEAAAAETSATATTDADTAGETPATSETASDPVAAETTPEQPAEPAAAPDQPVTVVRRGVPVWLLVIAAIVPAVLVGAIVFFLVGSDEGEDSTAAAGVVDGLMRLGQADQSNISSYSGELPPDFTTDFPLYNGADIVVSIAMASEQGTGYLIVMSTPDSTQEVFGFYNEALDTDPWQVEVGRSSDEFTGLRFLRPDNIDVSGDVSLHRSSLDEQTVIYLSYTDISQAILPGGDPDPFNLGSTRPLPAGFPDDIPIYEGTGETVVLDTYWERGQGGRAFIVTFLTPDSQDDVIEFYRSEFEGRGWVVSDAGVSSTSFALAIEFDDGPDQSVSGSITADSFEEDPAFTQVDLLVTTSTNRN